MELLLEGVLVVFQARLGEACRLLEILLLLEEHPDRLVHLQGGLREGVPALSQELLAQLVVGVDVQVALGDDVDQVLQGVLVDADRPRVEALGFQHVAAGVLDLEDVDGELLGVDAGVGGSERHELL